MSLERITKALQNGCRLHAFRSGGGLRVVRVEKGKKLKGYGEDVSIHDALVNADKNLAVLSRRRKSVYLTGSRSAADALDGWILCGHTFDAWIENGQIVVQLLNPYHREDCPQDVLEDAVKNGWTLWHNRGGITKIHQVSCQCSGRHRFGGTFDNTHWSFSLKTIRKATQPLSFPVAKTGRGKDFDEALKNALEAPTLEVSKQKAA